MAELDLIKLPGEILRPSLPQDIEIVQQWGNGELLRANIRKPVNGKFHRKMFALLNAIFQGQERYEQFDHLRTAITVMAGFYDHVVMPNGRSVYQPSSWSYANMDQTEKEILYSRIIDLGLREFLPCGWTEEELEKQVHRLLRFDG